MVLGTPLESSSWRSGGALVEMIRSKRRLRGMLPKESATHTQRCRARFVLLCAGEDGPVEARAQEEQPAPPDPPAPNLISTSTAAQTGGLDTDVMEDIEPAVSSRAHATAAPIRPFVTGGDETMEQEGPESKRPRSVAGLHVCSLLTRFLRVTLPHNHKTDERLSPHLVKVGKQTEHEAMTRHQLFERVPIAMARGKKVRCQWLDETKERAKWISRAQQTRCDGSGPWCTM